jgi:hypothetical protein
MIMYSEPTGLSDVELQARTLGTGVPRTLFIWTSISKMTGFAPKTAPNTHKIHCSYLRSSCEVRSSSIWIRDFSDNLDTIFHGQKEGFIMHSVCELADAPTAATSGNFGGNSCQFLDIKFDISLG